MKFTIFLCSAFIVSVACVTEPDEQKRNLEVAIEKCHHSITEARRELHQNYLDNLGPDMKNEVDEAAKQLAEVIRVAQTTSSMELPEPLPKTPGGIEIVCSKELADQVREIVKNEYAAVKALDA